MSVAPIPSAAAALRAQIVGEAETRLIAALGAAPAAETPAVAPAANPVARAVDQARAAAAGRQDSLAPLFANLAQALRMAGAPAGLRQAIVQVLALQASAPFTAETLQRAVARSGLFLEAHLAALPAGEIPPPDLKAALLTLQRALAAPPTPGAAPEAPPPARDAALTPQPPVTPTLPPGADPAVVARQLGREADQAIARQVLHQLASLPDGATTAWMFELPIATPQGTAIAQCEIDRERQARGQGQATETWRLRFSIDLEPLGPVHVHLSAQAGRAAVTVWAEREAGLEQLRIQGGRLAQDLPADVVFHLGAPTRPAPPSGGFVDRTL